MIEAKIKLISELLERAKDNYNKATIDTLKNYYEGKINAFELTLKILETLKEWYKNV